MTRRRVAGCAAVVAAMLAATVSGCEKTAVATSVSPCFRVLPQAHAAIGGQGAFVDVARRKGPAVYPSSGGRIPFARRPGPSEPAGGALSDTTTTAAGATAHPSTVLPDSNDPRLDVCVVAYRGTFDPAKITHLRGPAVSGRYAIVLVGVRTEQVRAVVLSDRLPPALHHH